MPAGARARVKSKTGRRQTKPTRRTMPKTGVLQSAGSFLDELCMRAVGLIITYTAVGLTSVAIIVILMLFAGGYFFNFTGHVVSWWHTLGRSAGFEITYVTLKGAQRTTYADIIFSLNEGHADQVLGRTMFQFDANTARDNIESLNWVQHAAVVKLWPDTVHISIAERRPAAIWQKDGDGAMYLVDINGVVVTEVEGGEYTELLVLVGTRDPSMAQPILKALAAYPALERDAAALIYQGARRWDLRFKDGFVAMLPEQDFSLALQRLSQLKNNADGLSERLEYLNMRDDAFFYYQTKDSTVSQKKN